MSPPLYRGYCSTNIPINMARLNPTLGKMKGSIGGTVMAVNSGVQIIREKPISVANPSTPAQVNQRAKLKLASQIAAALATSIAIPKDGIVSPRNQFVKKNFGYFMASDGDAQVSYENLQLTNGTAGLPQITATRSSANGIIVELAEDASASLSRVFYAVYSKGQEGRLILIGDTVVSEEGENGTFPGSFPYYAGEIVIFAYGMRDLSAGASATYANYKVENGSDLATLVSSKKLAAGDYQFTQTRGVTMDSQDNIIEPTDPDKVRIFATAVGSGTVSGAGTYNIGDSVTLVATPTGTGSTFQGWYNADQTQRLSSSASWTFTAQNQVDAYAVFEVEEGPGGGTEG